MNLMEKTKVINNHLQSSTKVTERTFQELAQVISSVTNSIVFIFDDTNELIGCHSVQEVDLTPSDLERLKSIDVTNVQSTVYNVEANSTLSLLPFSLRPFFPKAYTSIIPVIGSNSRLGTLALVNVFEGHDDDDIILTELSATIIGIKIMQKQNELNQKERQDKLFARVAISSLSYSEQIAIEKIVETMEESNQGLVVASQIADKEGITRSVIVNTLRKLASAAVLESRSLGMKGTFIKFINPHFKEELEKSQIS